MTETRDIINADQAMNIKPDSIAHDKGMKRSGAFEKTEVKSVDATAPFAFGMGARYYDELNVTSPYTFWNGA